MKVNGTAVNSFIFLGYVMWGVLPKKNPNPGGGFGLRPIGVKYAVHDPRYLDFSAQPMFILTFGGK